MRKQLQNLANNLEDIKDTIVLVTRAIKRNIVLITTSIIEVLLVKIGLKHAKNIEV